MWMPASKEQSAKLVLLLSCIALLAAWIGEYVFGLQACNLCLYQRYVYLAVIAVLALHLFFFNGHYPRFFLSLSSLLLFLCAGIAAYQVGVEMHWIELPSSCKAPKMPDSFEAFKQMVTTKPHVPCDQVQWSLFGISMAGYNVIYAAALGLLAFGGVFLHGNKKKKFTRR